MLSGQETEWAYSIPAPGPTRASFCFNRYQKHVDSQTGFQYQFSFMGLAQSLKNSIEK